MPVTPEPLRTFGYPGFLALIEKVAGPGHLHVVIVQVLLAATMPVLVFLLARPYLTERQSLVAAWAAALYVPFAYYAVFALSDLLATVLVAGASAACARAATIGSGRALVLAGALFGAAGLVRPSLLVLGVVLVLPFLLRRGVRRLAITAVAVAAFLLVGAVPSYAYTLASFDRFAVNAAGGGIGIWYGYWHGVWSGKTTEAILAAGERATSPEQLARELAPLGVDEAKAATYVREYRALGLVLEPAGWSKDALARYLDTDAAYRDLALQHVRADLAGWAGRGLFHRSPILWFGEVPVAQDVIGRVPPPVLLVLWGLQAALAALAAVGAVVLVRRKGGAALWLGAGLLALWGAHFAFSAEARYTLPVKGWLIVLAVAGGAYLLDRLRGPALRSAPVSGA